MGAENYAAVRRDWSSDLRGGGPIESGHHLAEEAPEELAGALIPFPATLPATSGRVGTG